MTQSSALGAAGLLVALLAGSSVAGQALPVGQGRTAQDVLAIALADRLDSHPNKLDVEVIGVLSDRVDSLAVDGGGASRWNVTTWKDGVPTRRFLRVAETAQVPVAERRIERDAEVRPEDVRLEERFVPREAHVDPLGDPIGMVATRVVSPGEVLLPPTVRPPLLFRGGDEVEAVLIRDGVVLTVRAEALRSARAGESVHVRLPSGARVTARAVGPGRVELVQGRE